MSTSRTPLPRLSTAELVRRRSAVVVVDAHGSPYFSNGHIPGAVNIPPHRVAELAPSLLPEKDIPIVVYGAHPNSRGADAVIRQLAALGYHDVSRYLEGKAGWAEAGLPLIGDADG